MSKKKTPAELAGDVIKLLKKKEFNLPRPSFGSGYPEAIAKIAGKICDGADLGELALFTDTYRQTHRQHFIHRDQTLLHLFADVSPHSMGKDDYEIVFEALKRLLVPNPATGKLYFDLEHRDDVHGQAPLHLAAKSGTPAVCQVFLEAGADPAALSTGGCFKSKPETPLTVALWLNNHEAARVIRTWIAKQAIDSVLERKDSAPTAGSSQP